MKVFKKLSYILPRPSLLWLSRRDIVDFRNKLYNLYEPNEIEIPETKNIYVKAAVAPQFRFGSEFYYLNCQDKDRNPYWVTHEGLERKPVYLAFDDESVEKFSKLVIRLIKEFPFKQTNNYLLNGGAFIA